MSKNASLETQQTKPQGLVCTAIVRHSLSRRKGWKMPLNTVKVSRPGKWGNPFLVGPERTQGDAVGTC